LIYTDEQGRRRQKSLGHKDARKAERQKAQFERELRMGAIGPGSMKLSEFTEDSLRRTGSQIRQSTQKEYRSSMRDFIKVVGNIDYQKITIEHAECYRQACLDRGNSPATVSKKLTEIKCVFETAVKRKQLDENPLKHIKKPSCPKGEIHRYSQKECERIVKAARDFTQESNPLTTLRWDLLIALDLSTALRRGELLNLVWGDVDFEEQTVKVSPKLDTPETWEWRIKDTDKRILPLTKELIQLLADHQSRQPEGYPYVFVPPARYDWIQKRLRAKEKWTYSDSRLKVVNNFKKHFDLILARARVERGTFHDVRRTAICNLFAEGISEYDVMKLAGHADFTTTHKFYLAIADDILERARLANTRGLCQNVLQICCNSRFGLKDD